MCRGWGKALLLVFRRGNRPRCSQLLVHGAGSQVLLQCPACPLQGDGTGDSLVADRPDRTSVLCYFLTSLRRLRKLLISLSLKFIVTRKKARLLTPTSWIDMKCEWIFKSENASFRNLLLVELCHSSCFAHWSGGRLGCLHVPGR